MSKEDLAPFGGVVLAFMFVCAIIGGAAFLVVGGSSVQFFVGGRTLNVFVVTATLASQAPHYCLLLLTTYHSPTYYSPLTHHSPRRSPRSRSTPTRPWATSTSATSTTG